ncbi:hypothetical protein ACWDR0_06680 [Streptomyces sp. NPDC003691]
MSTSFFLAGVMQGAGRAFDAADQTYRARLRRTIEDLRPGATVHDPRELILARYGERVPEIRRALETVAAAPTVVREDLDPGLRELLGAFHEMARLAAASDICVARLPGNEPSMGTAAEMYAAFSAGRTVVAVTGMSHNIAVLACSTVVLPDEAAFHDWLVKDGDRDA